MLCLLPTLGDGQQRRSLDAAVNNREAIPRRVRDNTQNSVADKLQVFTVLVGVQVTVAVVDKHVISDAHFAVPVELVKLAHADRPASELARRRSNLNRFVRHVANEERDRVFRVNVVRVRNRFMRARVTRRQRSVIFRLNLRLRQHTSVGEAQRIALFVERNVTANHAFELRVDQVASVILKVKDMLVERERFVDFRITDQEEFPLERFILLRDRRRTFPRRDAEIVTRTLTNRAHLTEVKETGVVSDFRRHVREPRSVLRSGGVSALAVRSRHQRITRCANHIHVSRLLQHLPAMEEIHASADDLIQRFHAERNLLPTEVTERRQEMNQRRFKQVPLNPRGVCTLEVRSNSLQRRFRNVTGRVILLRHRRHFSDNALQHIAHVSFPVDRREQLVPSRPIRNLFRLLFGAPNRQTVVSVNILLIPEIALSRQVPCCWHTITFLSLLLCLGPDNWSAPS